MSDNLIKSDGWYYHPLTRIPAQHNRYWIDARTGEEHLQVPDTKQPVFRRTLTPEMVCRYYYDQVNMPSTQQKLARDCGAVRHMTRTLGVDLMLFAIDQLASVYLEAQERPGSAPDLIAAADYAEAALHALGVAKAVMREYGVSE